MMIGPWGPMGQSRGSTQERNIKKYENYLGKGRSSAAEAKVPAAEANIPAALMK